MHEYQIKAEMCHNKDIKVYDDYCLSVSVYFVCLFSVWSSMIRGERKLSYLSKKCVIVYWSCVWNHKYIFR